MSVTGDLHSLHMCCLSCYCFFFFFKLSVYQEEGEHVHSNILAALISSCDNI